jgi:ABC-2 type transport system permease protein
MNGLLHHLRITFSLNFRSKQAIIYGYVVPIFFLLAFGVVFATKPPLLREMGQLITVTILGGACFGMPTAMVAERERGVWRRYRLLPTAIGGIIVSSMVVRYVIVLSAAVLQIFLAHFFLKTPYPEHPWQMLGAFTFVCFAFLGMGLVIAMLATDVPAVQALGQAIFLPMIMIGGVGVPLDRLQSWVQRVAAFLPGRYAVQALEECQHGVGLSAAHFDLLALTVIGLAALLAGAKMFRWDMGQKLTGPAKGWVTLAIAAWAFVGIAAIATGRLKSDIATPTPLFSSNQTPPAPEVKLHHPPASAPSTNPLPATTSAVATTTASQPATGWQAITKEQIEGITYDDLPDDTSTTTPFARDLNGLDDDGKKRMENLNDDLGDWPPAQVKDVVQRVRNLLSVCAIADVAEDQNESQIPFVVFDYLRGSIPKDQLIKALVYIILNDRDGAVLTNLKDFKDLAIDAEIGEDDVRMRSVLYAKKMLFRLLGKMPPENKSESCWLKVQSR